ncbi:19863_t:CDS:2 [Funneliformis geosporum]|uniref:19863_t:CDS:1 n=1 Tax=Funneliformis geosporum TaxID=1117311 RepID=A0A9W4WTL0_9GLOM|nr:19863_t:CDS:2 [Funneliformis geosporum]
MSSSPKHNALKQSITTDSFIPFSILPSPFKTVLVISALQHQQAAQKVAEIEQEVKNAGGMYEDSDSTPYYLNLPLIAMTKEEKKYLIQQQFIALPDEQYFLTVDELQRHKDLLQELEKYEHAVEKLQKSGGYAACSVQFLSKQGDSSSRKNLPNEASDTEYSLPPLKSGARTLAKFLSLVEDDSLDDLSNRVGDILTSTKNTVRQSGTLNKKHKTQFSLNTNNEASKCKGEFTLSKTGCQTNHDFVASKNEFDKQRDKTIMSIANDSARSHGDYGRQH